MGKRILTGAILVVALGVPFLFANNLIFKLIIALISSLAAFELLKCANTLDKCFLSTFLMIFAFASPILITISTDVFFYISLILIFYCVSVPILTKQQTSFNDASISFFLIFYIIIGFAHFVLLREYSRFAFWLIFIGAWGCDTFAYFTGMFFGKHKLIPSVSPKKTIEGSVGGTLITATIFPLYGFLTGFSDNYFGLFILGVVASVTAQVGDLAMSVVKRNYMIKDFGNILPGHGGIMDRFDSAILVAPMLYIIIVKAGLIV